MNNFRIKTYVLGMVSTNCYLIYNNETKEAVVADPADRADYIRSKCLELDVTPVAILLTHGHFDHIMAAEELRRAYGCKLYAGREEEKLLLDPRLNASVSMGGKQTSLRIDVQLQDGDVLDLIGFSWKVIATPGHTSGSVCYYIRSEDVLISGDTLFAESLGRTDLPTGSSSAIIRSISEKLLVLPEDTMVYPGHGDSTTIAHEKRCNPVAVYCRRR